MRLVDDARPPGQAQQHVRELEVAGEDGRSPAQGGQREERGSRQERRARHREGAAAVQDAEAAHAQAGMGRDAVEGKDLGRRTGVALADER